MNPLFKLTDRKQFREEQKANRIKQIESGLKLTSKGLMEADDAHSLYSNYQGQMNQHLKAAQECQVICSALYELSTTLKVKLGPARPDWLGHPIYQLTSVTQLADEAKNRKSHRPIHHTRALLTGSEMIKNVGTDTKPKSVVVPMYDYMEVLKRAQAKAEGKLDNQVSNYLGGLLERTRQESQKQYETLETSIDNTSISSSTLDAIWSKFTRKELAEKWIAGIIDINRLQFDLHIIWN